MRASESDRAVLCPGSLVLPRYDRKSPKTQEAADWGTLCHYWKETGELVSPFPYPLVKQHVKDLNTLDEKLLLSGTQREDWWPAKHGEHEVSFAIRLRNGALELYKGAKANGDLWKLKFPKLEYVTGTIDWVEWGADGDWPLVDDLKTGHWTVDPAESLQHRTYALVPWLAAGGLSKFYVGVTTTKWEKYPLDGQPIRTPTHWSSALELECHLDDLRYAAAHPNEVNPVPISIGKWDPNEKLSHCAFCPCRPEFPVAEWLSSFKYRAAPHCMPGMMERINGRV